MWELLQITILQFNFEDVGTITNHDFTVQFRRCGNYYFFLNAKTILLKKRIDSEKRFPFINSFSQNRYSLFKKGPFFKFKIFFKFGSQNSVLSYTEFSIL
ncbi:hypothetical protein LEP1GSC186_2808 [Leptospira noguchii serovar Autumnalis str. ZUN142]|uniref:Uncharacterized protein n=1 Tax=Leptospira noguchii serovar Autumnalis str. ZUN142 TaxID=1085540 RepID=M6UPL1_9LEPT|nr:hypothetical protein LEP1GSC186_2808 [Leptospira noguchii serovar Autumnalis str. ZUN142]